MDRLPEPNVRELLLPLLSCLPTAFVSPRPPPAFPLLLSPILRQRVHLRSSNRVASAADPSSSSSNWLSLLTWSPSRAARLVEVCSDLHLEPHPVSGELELFSDEADEEAGKPQYRRLDSETIHARCEVREHDLAVVWVWCENDNGSLGLPVDDEAGEPQDGWKVTEVLSLSNDEGERILSDSQWYNSIGAAEEAYAADAAKQGSPEFSSSNTGHLPQQYSVAADSRDNGDISATPGVASNAATDDDDYWASYDRTPHKSPAPPTPSNAGYAGTNNVYNPSRERQPSTSVEAEYYARYGSVQPAMDGHDPDEEEGASAFESTLEQRGRGRSERPALQDDVTGVAGHNNFSHDEDQLEEEEPPITTAARTVPLRIHSPTPSRPSTSGSDRKSPINTLEASASSSSAAEMGVRQHISTELKSLYRLARAAGIERSEFERVVKTELDVLGMMDF